MTEEEVIYSLLFHGNDCYRMTFVQGHEMFVFAVLCSLNCYKSAVHEWIVESAVISCKVHTASVHQPANNL